MLSREERIANTAIRHGVTTIQVRWYVDRFGYHPFGEWIVYDGDLLVEAMAKEHKAESAEIERERRKMKHEERKNKTNP